jgi:hypothetical protein
LNNTLKARCNLQRAFFISSFLFTVKTFKIRLDTNPFTLIKVIGILMKCVVILLLSILFCNPLIALAELPEDVAADFSVLSGTVIMPVNDEYIVDLDDRNDLSIGDILTVVAPGKKILHPETGKVIGSIDNVLGFLQVTRIYSGYSYAKVLSENLAPENGTPVKRFEQVPALFVDNTEDAKALARQIKVDLPQFDWLDSNEAERALLTFTLEEKHLDIRNQQGDQLHRYMVTDDEQLASTAGSTPGRPAGSHVKPKPKMLQQFANNILGSFGATKESRFAEMDEAIIRQKQIDREGIWMGPSLAGRMTSLSVADLDGDGQQETAVVLDNRLMITRIADNELFMVAELDLPRRLQILTMDAVDLDGNGRAELYLSALSGYDAKSFVVEFTGESYEIIIKDIPWLLRSIAFPDQQGASLFGQEKVEDVDSFYGNIFHVKRKGDQLLKGDEVSLPSKLNLFNFLPFKDEKQKLNYAYLSQGDYLKVVSDKNETLWGSANYFGGSDTCYMPRKEFKDEMLWPTCVPQRMTLMPGGEVLVAQNDGQRVVKKLSQFKASRLVALNWDGYSLLESWRTASQSGYLADFVVADANNDGRPNLVMAVRFRTKGIIEDARSSIVTYELE